MHLNSKGILSMLVLWKRWVWVSIRDGVLKMTKGSMVIMKGVCWENLYYLKGSTVTGQVETSSSSDDDCTKVWQVKVGKEVKGLCKLLQRRDHWKVLLPAT